MSSLWKEITDDINEYVRLCIRWKEEVQKDCNGNPAAYSEHADSLRERGWDGE